MTTLDGDRLTVGAISAIAGGAPARLGAAGRARAGAAHALAVEVAGRRTVYGRTTGVGANKDSAVATDDALDHGQRLLASHATMAGPLRRPERVRATMAVRLNQLAAGGSGARPEVLDALAALLASGVVPAVREHGGVGTGDLGALATIAIALPEIRLGADDALPFLSSNAATVADAALGAQALRSLTAAGVAVAALTFVAVDGAIEAFAPAVERATPYAGVREVCAGVRSLVDGSGPARRAAARLQDPFALRCLPQVHGLALDALARLVGVVEDSACAAAENPVVDLVAGDVAHHGAFHAAYLADALDSARAAVARAATLSQRRVSFLLDPASTGLAPFLGDGTPGASGAMGLEYAGASAAGRLHALAAPVASQTAVLSHGVEDDASFASLAAAALLASVEDYAAVVAVELVAAVRALRLRGLVAPSGAGWGELLTACAGLPAEMADRDLTDDILVATDLLPGLTAWGASQHRSHAGHPQ